MPDVPQEWDFYLVTLDDAPAVISVNLALISLAPDETRPLRLHVRVPLLQPTDNGLIDSDERLALNDIEDALAAAMEETLDAIYAGRVISDGAYDLCYYAASDEGFDHAVAAAMRAFPRYVPDYHTVDDPQWEAYRDFLYPDRMSMQQIRNRAVLAQLEEHGDDLSTPREIIHFVYFTDPDNRRQYAIAAHARNFESDELDPLEDSEHPYGLTLKRIDHVECDSINALVCELIELADDWEGDYDGWECAVVRS